MRRYASLGILALTIGLAGCRAHTNPSIAGGDDHNSRDRLTGATVNFDTLDDNKDAKSAITVQLLRSGNQLAAEATSSGTEFKEHEPAPPLALTLRSPFTRADIETGQLRLRLTPDGRDTWRFNVRLSLSFADQTEQTYAWTAVSVDEKSPERTLVLAGARQP